MFEQSRSAAVESVALAPVQPSGAARCVHVLVSGPRCVLAFVWVACLLRGLLQGKTGWTGRTRTSNQLINSQLLHR